MFKPININKITAFKLFGICVFSREEVISTEQGTFDVEVQPEYYDSEFNIGGKDD